ncbi:MAG: helix-turn-helix domain-containing protein [Steroidobacteraceae bacterium]
MTDSQDRHWTDDSTEDYLHGISSGFVRAIESAMGDDITQGQLAERLGVSESRVSQVLNNPGNLTLRKIIEYSRALHLNVAIVAYEGRGSKRGLVPPEIFEKCWEKLGKPHDFFEFETCAVVTDSRYSYIIDVNSLINIVDFELPSEGVTTRASPMQAITGRYRPAVGTTGFSTAPPWLPAYQIPQYSERDDG